MTSVFAQQTKTTATKPETICLTEQDSDNRILQNHNVT